MSETSIQIGADLFTRKVIAFETVREVRGFQRRTFVRRVEYRINGKRTSRAVWLARKEA